MNNLQQLPQYNRPAAGYKPTQLDWIMVPTIDQVENVAVQPMQRAWVMVQNESIFALRTADQMGLVQTKYYKFDEYTPEVKTPYVTADQLDATIKDLKETINECIVKFANKPNEAPNATKRKTDNTNT